MKKFAVLVCLCLIFVVQSASAAGQKYPFQNPANFPAGSAERVLAQHIAAWRAQDWSGMVKYAEISWLQSTSNPAKTLAASYDFRPLKGFKVESIKRISSMINDVTCVVWFEFWKKIKKKHLTLRLVKEDATGKPSQNGTWKVSPSSLSESD